MWLLITDNVHLVNYSSHNKILLYLYPTLLYLFIFIYNVFFMWKSLTEESCSVFLLVFLWRKASEVLQMKLLTVNLWLCYIYCPTCRAMRCNEFFFLNYRAVLSMLTPTSSVPAAHYRRNMYIETSNMCVHWGWRRTTASWIILCFA